MSTLTRDDFMRELSRCTKNEGRIDLPSELLEGRAEFLFTMYQATHAHLTPAELNQSFIVMAGLLLGKYPKIAVEVASEDRVRLPYAALGQLPASKGKLTKQERLIFAFSVFHTVCMRVYDEESGEIHMGIRDIDSNEHAINLLVEDMDNHPERYAFLDAPGKSQSSKPSGKFGSKDNPVKAVSVADGYSYLNSLRDSAGLPVKYSRKGSMSGRNGGIIDCYTLYFSGGTMTLYIDPYSAENSEEAPEGLRIAGGDDELEALIMAAENGDGSAQFELGLRYYHGEGVRKNPQEAVALWRKAAEKGHVGAQFNLGLMLYNGEGVAQNYGEEFRWYYLAAQKGHLKAQTNLGLMYCKGYGVKQDYTQALKWYRLAADKGLPDAQHDLGFMYFSGEGVARDVQQAVSLWRKAAEQGYANSQNNLGFMYRTGNGLKQNYAEALRWYRLAAEQGNAESQNDLGEMYEKGEGVQQDIGEAVKWYRLAAKQGSEPSLMALQRLGKL